jgi:hypothetical protein
MHYTFFLFLMYFFNEHKSEISNIGCILKHIVSEGLIIRTLGISSARPVMEKTVSVLMVAAGCGVVTSLRHARNLCDEN